MPLLGQQEGIARHIKQVAATLQQPKAVLIVSAHWEVRQQMVCGAGALRGKLRQP